MKYHLTLRLVGEDNSFGPGPMRLLEGVAQTGSLRQAAQQMGMSYSKAWTMVRRMEKEWGFAILQKHAGGKDGGGSCLTEEGGELLKNYTCMLKEVEAAADAAFRKYF